MEFIKVQRPPLSFFEFLPDDWKKELLPQWIKLHATSEVFAFVEKGEVLCMGILFHSVLPELSPVEKIVKPYLRSSFYIGYLYTVPAYRGKGLASSWFNSIKKLYPKKSFWLTIEEANLWAFYAKLGFKKYIHPKLNKVSKEEQVLYYTSPLSAIDDY